LILLAVAASQVSVAQRARGDDPALLRRIPGYFAQFAGPPSGTS